MSSDTPLFTTQQMSTPRGFIECWFRLLSHHKTHAEAYEDMEQRYQMSFGTRKYKNFEAFKRAKKYHSQK